MNHVVLPDSTGPCHERAIVETPREPDQNGPQDARVDIEALERRQGFGCLARSLAYIGLVGLMTWAYGPGGLTVAFSLIIFVIKVGVSYDTEGGSIGMVPVLDGVVFPPIFFTFGVWFCHAFPQGNPWPFWAYLLLWVVSTTIAYFGITWAANMGERAHRGPGEPPVGDATP